MLVVFPGTYYASYNKEKILTVSTTYDMENAAPGGVAMPRKEDVRRNLKRVSAGLAINALPLCEARVANGGPIRRQLVRPLKPGVSPPMYNLHLPNV